MVMGLMIGMFVGTCPYTASYLLTKITLRFSDKLQTKLRAEGGIKALLGMVRCRHPDVLAQVARGIANFAKCESRTSSQGRLRKRPLDVIYFPPS